MAGSTQVKTQFREITGGTTRVQIADTRADYKDSMDILKKNGMRAMSYQEAFVQLKQNETLRNELKGKWFYIEGTGTDKSGLYTIDKKGELKQGKGKVEETVNVWKGSNPLSVYVHEDGNARYYGRRCNLYGGYSPVIVAPVVVGVKQGSQAGRIADGSTEITYVLENTNAALNATRRDVALAVQILVLQNAIAQDPGFVKSLKILRDAKKVEKKINPPTRSETYKRLARGAAYAAGSAGSVAASVGVFDAVHQPILAGVAAFAGGIVTNSIRKHKKEQKE